MKNIYYGGLEYFCITYRDFFIDNLSENGVIILKKSSENSYKEIKQALEKEKYLGKIDIVTIRIYDEIKKNIECYTAFVNDKALSSFGFFDFFKLLSCRLNLGEFYAFTFKTDKSYIISPYLIKEIGSLKEFKNILNINEHRTIVLRKTKFVAPEGYIKYFSTARAFRNQVEKDFSIYEKTIGYQNFKKYHSFEECKKELVFENDTLKFNQDSILEFDIDYPSLTIKAKCLKARNLNIKNLYAENEDVFCANLICQNIKAGNILAESIECESILASKIKTNYKYGLKLISNC